MAWIRGRLPYSIAHQSAGRTSAERAIRSGFMRLQPEEFLAQTISAAMQKGGWLLGALGGMALIYLLQDRRVQPGEDARDCVSRMPVASPTGIDINDARWNPFAWMVAASASRNAE